MYVFDYGATLHALNHGSASLKMLNGIFEALPEIIGDTESEATYDRDVHRLVKLALAALEGGTPSATRDGLHVLAKRKAIAIKALARLEWLVPDAD